MPQSNPATRSDYCRYESLTTRWMDNDAFGHVNNATYYSYFDTAINQYLIGECGLDVLRGPIRGLIVHSECDYFRSVQFPQRLEVGLRVERLGSSSVHYGLALFAEGHEEAAARARMVHVFVDAATSRPTSVPEPLRRRLEIIAALGAD